MSRSFPALNSLDPLVLARLIDPGGIDPSACSHRVYQKKIRLVHWIHFRGRQLRDHMAIVPWYKRQDKRIRLEKTTIDK
jgi:hypothetical protein